MWGLLFLYVEDGGFLSAYGIRNSAGIGANVFLQTPQRHYLAAQPSPPLVSTVYRHRAG